jgi:hypothetical protein
MITNITPLKLSGSDDTNDYLEMFGYSMAGLPDSCVYTDWVAIQSPIVEYLEVITSGDTFALTCGYYVQYDWSGFDPVYFEIQSNQAASISMVGAFMLACFALLA